MLEAGVVLVVVICAEVVAAVNPGKQPSCRSFRSQLRCPGKLDPPDPPASSRRIGRGPEDVPQEGLVCQFQSGNPGQELKNSIILVRKMVPVRAQEGR